MDQLDPNKNQVIFLRSMQEQYASQGLKVLIVDASAATRGEVTSPARLINLIHDWNLEAIGILSDDQARAASSYRIDEFPTTMVIDKAQVMRARWHGFAPAHLLAFAVEAVLE